jgi:hypothetical protein
VGKLWRREEELVVDGYSTKSLDSMSEFVELENMNTTEREQYGADIWQRNGASDVHTKALYQSTYVGNPIQIAFENHARIWRGFLF